MPNEPEALGLLALLLLHDSRRRARFREGELLLLADQDRSLWDSARIARGRALLDRALALHGRGPYVLQVAIASLRTQQLRDWFQIAAPYGELARLTGSPVVELICTAALVEAGDLEGALVTLEQLELVIKYRPEESVVKLEPGEPIRLEAAQFDRLSKAFLAEIDTRFVK